ncbi:MAG TPA: DUF2480 family protein [Chitinophagaceae bacterium]|nr:DUF2480 family protein [Chitinophagaceae bacterium]
MNDPIVNRVAESELITLDPAKYFPRGETAVFDLKDHLFMEMILKEKDFREALKKTDWPVYKDKNIALTCSADAIIPVWAWMLAASYLQPVAKEIVMGDEKELQKKLFLKNISEIDVNEFADKKVVIKGCGETPIGDYVYMELTKLLRPVAKSIMYGEPCSTVPVYKKFLTPAQPSHPGGPKE